MDVYLSLRGQSVQHDGRWIESGLREDWQLPQDGPSVKGQISQMRIEVRVRYPRCRNDGVRNQKRLRQRLYFHPA